MLSALDSVVNFPDILKHREPIAVDAIVYGSMIQCGVERFEIPNGFSATQKNRYFPQSKFLKARISELPKNKPLKSQKLVKEFFDKFLPKDFRKTQEFSDVAQLEQFIVDIIFSAERKTSCMTLLPVPDIEKLENQLPSALLFPIKNLLGSFEPVSPSLPYPKMSASTTDINRFEELISSDLYSHYAIQHESLEKSTVSKENALTLVVESGKNVFQKNVDFLQLKDLTISVLPVTASLIDIVFGKLPGALADYSAKLLTGLLKDERRIVVYQLDSIFNDLITTYVPPYIKNL